MEKKRTWIIFCEILFGFLLISLLLVASVTADPAEPSNPPDITPDASFPLSETTFDKAQDLQIDRGGARLEEPPKVEHFSPITLRLQTDCDTSALDQRLRDWQAEGLARDEVVKGNDQLQITVDSELVPRIRRLPCVEQVISGWTNVGDGIDPEAKRHLRLRDEFELEIEPDSASMPTRIDSQVNESGDRGLDGPRQKLTEAQAEAIIATGGIITGTVTAQDTGGPLQNIDVTVCHYGGFWWCIGNSDSTDLQGNYEITGLSTETVRLAFYDSDGVYIREYYDDAPDVDSATSINVVDGEITPGKNAVLSKGSHIVGTVKAEDNGALLTDIAVSAYRFDGSRWNVVRDNVTVGGIYDIGSLPADTYRVGFSDYSGVYINEFHDGAPNINSATDFDVTAGVTTTLKEATLVTAGHITGTVTAVKSGAPLQSVYITAYRFNGSSWEYFVGESTDSLGSYDLGGLSTDTYRVKFGAPFFGNYIDEYYDDAPEIDSATDVDVIVGKTTPGISAALSERGHITGTVTAYASGSTLQGITVCAYYDNGYQWSQYRCDNTDSSGDYDIDGLLTNTFRVKFSDASGSYATEYYDDASAIENATDVLVSVDSTTPGIDAALSEYGRITGTVTADVGGASLSDIKVNVHQFNGSRWRYVGNGNTDLDGNYNIGGLDTGTYRVGFQDRNAGIYAREYYDGAPDIHIGTDIAVTVGSIVTDVNAALVAAGHITGKVTADEDGTSLAGIKACGYYDMGSFWDYSNCGISDANGDYDIGGLSTGAYRVSFYDSNGIYVFEFYEDAPYPNLGKDILVSAGSTTAGIDAGLSEPGAIQGRVTSAEDGSPLWRLEVDLYALENGTWNWWDGESPDSNGEYHFGSLRPGKYRVRFSNWDDDYLDEYYLDAPDLDNATDVDVLSGQTTSGIDGVLAVAGRITGTVKSEVDGSPLEYIDVDVYRWIDGRWRFVAYDETDTNGNYDVGGVNNDIHKVRFTNWSGTYAREYYDDMPDAFSATDIQGVAGSTVPGIDAELEIAGHITGTVTAEESGAPLQDIDVYTYRYNGSYYEYVGYGYTDVNGHYDVGRMLSGNYRVVFEDYWDVYVSEAYDDAPFKVFGDDVPVTSGTTTGGIDAAMSLPASLSGRVTDKATGFGLPGILVEPIRFNGVGWDYGMGSYTDQNGQFQLSSLLSGTYKVEYWDQSATFAAVYYDDALGFESATEISVLAGSSQSGIDAAMETAGQISGTVSAAADSSPLAGIYARAYRFNGSDWEYTMNDEADSSGQYEIERLPAGTYRVEFVDYYGPFISEYFDNASDVGSATDVIVSAGATTANIDAALSVPATPPGTISGVISGTISGSPQTLEGAAVQVCTSSGSCGGTTTNANGEYTVDGLAAGEYTVTTFPPSAHSNLLPGTLGPISLVPAQTRSGQDMLLTDPTPPPPGTLISAIGTTDNGVPVVGWDQNLTLVTEGCANGTASYEIVLGGSVIGSGALTETPPGSGHYEAVIPPLVPNSGAAAVEIAIDCPSGPDEAIDFDIYIDPSGFVQDENGDPIAGATVTLFRSDSLSGPFVVVADGNSIMSPANRSNPSITDSDGRFGWDVLAGYYKVRAEKKGCVAADNAALAFTESPVLTIPPPVTDLVLILRCQEYVYLPVVLKP